jgi:hypothetical protein
MKECSVTVPVEKRNREGKIERSQEGNQEEKKESRYERSTESMSEYNHNIPTFRKTVPRYTW